MNSIYADSIAHVKSLYKDDIDPLHDFSHSERDAELAKDIARHVGYSDLDLIELIALWHDAARALGVDEGHEHEGAKMAREDLLKRGVDKEIVDKVYKAIYDHSHDPTVKTRTLEGKIFKDADKIEVHSVARVKKAAAAGWNKHQIAKVNGWYANIPQYSADDFYEFDYSRELAKKHIVEFKDYYESIKDQLAS